MNPLMRFYQDRQQIPQSGREGFTQPGQPQQMPQQGGMMGGSQGLFGQYMSQLFNRKYAPPMMQGSPLQSYGGFMGFGSPQMSRMQPPQQQPQQGGYSPNPQNTPGMNWGEYLNAGS